MRNILALLVAILPLAVPAKEITQNALQTGDIVAGKIWYGNSCSRCHRSAAALLPGIPGTDEREKAVWLDGFLVNHYSSNDDMRRDIIAYILSFSR